MWQFAASCEGIKQACRELNTQLLVEMYLYTMKQTEWEFFPTPSIAMVGVNDDANKVLPSCVQKMEIFYIF